MSRHRHLRYSVRYNPYGPVRTREEAFEILQLPQSAGTAEIEAAYKRLRFKYHPDRNLADPQTAQDNFIRARAAYELLTQAAPQTGERGRHPEPAEREWKPRTEMSRPWTTLLPGLNMKSVTAFVGLRADGKIDLYVNNTYKATLPAPDAAAYLIYEGIHSLLDKQLRVAAVHFIILGVESRRQHKVMSLPAFAKLIGFTYVPGSPPHLPPERGSGVGPEDF